MELFNSVLKYVLKSKTRLHDLHVCGDPLWSFLLHRISPQVFAPKTQSITARICADNKIICYLKGHYPDNAHA